jgi:putative colanic acid biosynthesis acetyltransferase WcaF
MATWWFVQTVLFRPSPHKLNRFRCWLLRRFGARIGSNTFIYSSARIWFPWHLTIGSNAGIGFDALIYNLDTVDIGDFATVSQRVHVNTGSHDYADPTFPLITRPVIIGDGAFIGADAYVGWGVSIGRMAVIGARSVVVSDMPDFTVCVGHPCQPLKRYTMKNSEDVDG